MTSFASRNYYASPCLSPDVPFACLIPCLSTHSATPVSRVSPPSCVSRTSPTPQSSNSPLSAFLSTAAPPIAPALASAHATSASSPPSFAPGTPSYSVNPFAKYRIADFGDLPVNPLSIEDTFLRIEQGIAPLLQAGVRCVCVGGDHSISLPILRAVAKKHGPVSLIQFDAHNDLWDEYFGSKYSHGTPFRRAFEEGLLLDGGVLQVGLRGQVYGEDDFDFARAHKVKMVTAEDFHRIGLPAVQRHLRAFRKKPVYVTLDIDCVDPAYAPGTGTPQVGGFTSIQILELVRALRGLHIVGCDLVEVSPPYDTGEITSLLAANLLYELLCVL